MHCSNVSLSLNSQRVLIVDNVVVNIQALNLLLQNLYTLMFLPIDESFMQHVTVYLTKVGQRVKLFKFN